MANYLIMSLANFFKPLFISAFSVSEKSIGFLLPSTPRSLCLMLVTSGQYSLMNGSSLINFLAALFIYRKLIHQNNMRLIFNLDQNGPNAIFEFRKKAIKKTFRNFYFLILVVDNCFHSIIFYTSNIVTKKLLNKYIL